MDMHGTKVMHCHVLSRSLAHCSRHRLLRLIAVGLQLPGSFFDDKFDAAVSNVRALRYLPGAHSAAEGIFGVGAHTDWGMLTVLATDSTPGLQARRLCAVCKVADTVHDDQIC